MDIHPSRDLLEKLVRHQVHGFFLLEKEEESVLSGAISAALERVEVCFAKSENKYYWKDGEVFFSIYHSGQYCIFLYFLSRELFVRYPERAVLADKVYYLNKALNGLDLYYEVVMPDVFHLDHPVGSVLGRAVYQDGFTFSQNCTVGNNKGVFPVFGKNVRLFSGAKVLGACVVGDNVDFSANSYVKDVDIPDDSIVFGVFPDLVIKRK